MSEYPISQMTKIVPFLLLGIGVDDIFVIVQASDPEFYQEKGIISPCLQITFIYEII